MPDRKILIICPSCSKRAQVPVPEELIKNKETGATSVHIPVGLCCDHTFYAYIDKNFMVRDYLIIEHSLMDQARKAQEIKQKILSQADKVNLEYENIMKFISEKDLKSLLFAGYIDSPIILIENNIDQERFIVLFNLLAKFFKNFSKNCNIFTTEQFNDYEKTKPEKLEYHTVYNIMYKKSVKKPFNDSDADLLGKSIQIYKESKPKLRIILARNYIDYLRKWSLEYQQMKKEKPEKILKNFKKKYPRQDKYLGFEIFPVLELHYTLSEKIKSLNIVALE